MIEFYDMMRMRGFFFLFLTASTLLMGAQGVSPFTVNQQAPHVVIDNQVLATVNGKPITLLDVVKKMDIILLKQFPEYTGSEEARYQFYHYAWKKILGELIDKELIIADSEEVQMKVSSSDIRQEIQAIFGPNIFENLEKAGLTFEEAKKIVEGDIVLRRMIQVRVTGKSQLKVTPEQIKKAYEEMKPQLKKPGSWTYQVISIRGKNPKEAERKAKEIEKVVKQGQYPLEDLPNLSSKDISVTVSTSFTHSDQEASESYKNTLTSLHEGEISPPILQKSRDQETTLYRIFLLYKRVEGGITPFAEVEGKIQKQLLEKVHSEEQNNYLARLRHHFDVNDAPFQGFVTSGKEPFSLVK